MDRDILAEAIGLLPFPSFWTLDELARLLETDLPDVKRLLRECELPAFHVGGQWLVSTADLIRWLLLNRRTGAAGHGRARRRI